MPVRSTAPRRRRRMIAAFAAASLVTFAPSALADPIGTQQRVTADPSFNIEGEDPSIAGGTDRSLAVFERHVNGGGRTIHGRFVDGSGAPLGAGFEIDDLTEDPDEPDVVYNAARDEFLVAWNDDGYVAFAQRVAADGTLRGGRISLGGNDVDDLALGWSSTRDEYLAVWSNGSQIEGRRIAGNGAVIGDDIEDFTNGMAVSNNDDPDVAHDPTTGRWLLTWEAFRSGETSDNTRGVFGHLLDAVAVPEGTLITIDNQGSNVELFDPAVASNAPGGGFRVAYGRVIRNSGGRQLRARAAGFTPTGEEILVRDVTGAGATPEGSIQVSRTGPGEGSGSPARRPQIARDHKADEFLVVWEEDMSGNRSTEREIFGQRLAADGTQLGTDDARISTHGEDGNSVFDGDHAYVAYTRNACTYAVAWEGEVGEPLEEQPNRRKDEVFARAFDAPDCPPVQQQAQQQQQSTTPPSASLPVICVSARRFGLHLQRGRRRRITSASATLDGVPIRVTLGRNVVRVGIDLRGRPAGTYTLRVRARRSDGQRISLTRRYRTCVPRDQSNPPA